MPRFGNSTNRGNGKMRRCVSDLLLLLEDNFNYFTMMIISNFSHITMDTPRTHELYFAVLNESINQIIPNVCDPRKYQKIFIVLLK